MMARYPKARWRPVARYQSGGRVCRAASPKQRRVMLHTAVSNGASLYGLFSQSGTATSHFYVAKDGDVEQYIDTRYQSTAALQGNRDSITIETWDGGQAAFNGGRSPRWTDAQMGSLADLLAWCHREHGILLAQLPDSKPGRNGVCYHRQGVDPWRVAGGEQWSKSRGKICPGPARIAQIPDLIAAARGEKGTAAVNEEDLDVDEKTLRKIIREEVWAADFMPAPYGDVKANPTWKGASVVVAAAKHAQAAHVAAQEALIVAKAARSAAERAVKLLEEDEPPAAPSPPPVATLRKIAAAAGFTGDAVKIAAAVAMAESGGFVDAVGDYWQIQESRVIAKGDTLAALAKEWRTTVDKIATLNAIADPDRVAVGALVKNPTFTDTQHKWGPSVGLWQIRTLRDPAAWGGNDRLRDLDELRDPVAQARAAFAISKGGTDWTPWSTWRNGSHTAYLEHDLELRTGHAEAPRWRLSGLRA